MLIFNTRPERLGRAACRASILSGMSSGAGITLACGSGTCAAAVAAHLRGLTGRRVTVQADGGVLRVDWRDDGVWLTGPVAYVFEGRLSADMMALVAQ